MDISKFLEEIEKTGVLIVDIGDSYTEEERTEALKQLAYALKDKTNQRQRNLECTLITSSRLRVSVAFNRHRMAIAYAKPNAVFDPIVGGYIAMSRFSEGQSIPMPICPNGKLDFITELLELIGKHK